MAAQRVMDAGVNEAYRHAFCSRFASSTIRIARKKNEEKENENQKTTSFSLVAEQT